MCCRWSSQTPIPSFLPPKIKLLPGPANEVRKLAGLGISPEPARAAPTELNQQFQRGTGSGTGNGTGNGMRSSTGSGTGLSDTLRGNCLGIFQGLQRNPNKSSEPPFVNSRRCWGTAGMGSGDKDRRKRNLLGRNVSV